MTTSHNAHQGEFRAERELGIKHTKLGMWLFIASEVMFFGGLMAAFLHYKFNNPTPETALLDVVLVGVNTFILLSSSYTVVRALEAARAGEGRELSLFLGVTILLGALFLSGQGYEFFSLFQEGMTPRSTVFASSFFTLTSFHGLHVLIGILWAARDFRKALRGDYLGEEALGIELFGLYWHFVDIVWIILFTIIYLI